SMAMQPATERRSPSIGDGAVSASPSSRAVGPPGVPPSKRFPSPLHRSVTCLSAMGSIPRSRMIFQKLAAQLGEGGACVLDVFPRIFFCGGRLEERPQVLDGFLVLTAPQVDEGEA